MADKDDHLTAYREFFEDFAQTVNPNDQLPVRLASYKLLNREVVGATIDWTSQYLTQKKCPPSLTSTLIKIVIEELRKQCKKDPIKCGFNQSDNAYEPLKLMQTVMAKTNEVCLRYLDNSMLCSLPPPGPPFCVTSVCAVKNNRRRMEDRHVVINDLNTMFNNQEASPSSYYAIFDGHAGVDAAAYSSAHLHQYLAENQHYITDPALALRDAFCKTDALFIEKCRVESLSSGTTAVCALLRPKEKMLYVAWAGDSQALLVKQNNKMLQAVEPHKPSREDERARIEGEGGCCLLCWGTWRVNGQLAVSRAIGDADYKPYVTAQPDVRVIPLDGDEDFLILACDGLWDYVKDECCASAVYDMLLENPEDTARISQELVDLAKEEGSPDNISVIVVFLKEPSKIAEAEARWANRNGTMEAKLDTSPNPFSSNGAPQDEQLNPDGLLLNLTDSFKANGSELSPEFEDDKGKAPASPFDDDLGPESNVDSPDLVMIPTKNLLMDDKMKFFSEDVEERMRDTPTPPAEAAHDVGGLDNAAESDSEDEWNYFKGGEADKENKPPQLDLTEEEENMSQLNPNAAEFVPVSPTRTAPPACMNLINDQILAQSPKASRDIDLNIPNENDFDLEVKSRPSELEPFSNGHNKNDRNGDDLEDLLNGKNLEEIPEFQPSPIKDEFHFGPNAAPFTPSKGLDQSEAGLSTNAVFGDESVLTLGTTFSESTTEVDFVNNKESDPMSMSFYEGKEGENPFDLNKVQVLPDNIDDFLKPDENSVVSDHDKDLTLNNDDALQVTDLDKVQDDEEKELASPLDPEDDLLAQPLSPVPVKEEERASPLAKDEGLGETPTASSPDPGTQDSSIEIEKQDECKEAEAEHEAPLDSPFEGEEITSSVKDEASPVQDLISPIAAEESFEKVEESPVSPEIVAASPPPQDLSEEVHNLSSNLQEESINLQEESVALQEESCKVEESNNLEEVSRNLLDVSGNVQDLVCKIGALSLNSPAPVQPPVETPEEKLVEDVVMQSQTAETQFAEPAVLSPDDKSEEVVEAATVVEDKEEKQVEQEQVKEDVGIAAAAVGGAAVAAVAAAAVAEVVEEKKVTKEKEKEKAAPAKKPASAAGGKSPAVTKTKSPVKGPVAKAAPTTAAAKPKGVTKTSAAKPASASAPAPKPISRPTTGIASKTSTAKPAEKKPLTNGDVKTTRTTLNAKPPTARPTTASATASLTSARSPTKPASTRPSTATRTTLGKATGTIPKTAATTATKTTITRTSSATTTKQAATKTTGSLGSARSTTSDVKRPATASAAATRKVPLTKTVAKAPDAEKQSKDSANKLTASKTTTSRTVSSSTTLKKVEAKVQSRTIMKTATKTVGKKPAEIVRNAAKTTKIEKPKENGVSTVVTETIVNSSVELSEPMVKDNSPIDNKLIEGALIQAQAD